MANFPLSKQGCKIDFRGLQIEASHILIIPILVICPWGLFGWRFLIIFRTLSVEKFVVDRNVGDGKLDVMKSVPRTALLNLVVKEISIVVIQR